MSRLTRMSLIRDTAWQPDSEGSLLMDTTVTPYYPSVVKARPYGYGTSAYNRDPLGPTPALEAQPLSEHWPPTRGLRLEVSMVEKRQPVHHAQCTPEYSAL
eukprot:1607102-Rhodomonas_salina.2